MTLGVLASAERPITGYRLAQVAELRREKVYLELRKAIAAGSVVKGGAGYSLVDRDLRQLLRNRIPVTWDSCWDRLGTPSGQAAEEELRQIRRLSKNSRLFDPTNRIPLSAIRELERDPGKDRALRRLGLRPSRRKTRGSKRKPLD